MSVKLLILLFIFAAIFNFTAYGAGELDTGFNTSVNGSLNGNIGAIKVQPGGKVLVGGIFTDINGISAIGFGRLNVDGTLDTSFNPPDFHNVSGSGNGINAIALQADGKILVGGAFSLGDGLNINSVRRLNPNGSLDTSFNLTDVGTSWSIRDIEVQADGKIVIGGDFRITGFGNNIARLNADGTLDTTFSSSDSEVSKLEIQADGKILVLGFTPVTNLRRLNQNGTVDTTFPTINATISAIKIRPDGKILIAGGFASINGTSQGRIALLNSNGSLDTSFNAGGQGANNSISDIAFRQDGKIIISGGFSTYNTTARIKLAQLNADGTLDTSFQSGSTLDITNASPTIVEYLSDGKVLTGLGFFLGSNPLSALSPVTRFNTDGSLDSTFVPIIKRRGSVNKILPQPDGKTLVAGDFLFVNGVKRICLARLNANGSLDTSFVPFFNNTTIFPISYAIALQSDGKILVGFNNPVIPNGFTLLRLNADGSEDTSFSTVLTGLIYDIFVQSNGQILVGGTNVASGKNIVKLNANGSIDTSFAVVQPNNLVYKIIVQPDGKIFIGGAFTNIGTPLRGRIARLNSDGTLDNSFNPPGGANQNVLDMGLQTDGKIVVGGSFSSLNGSNNQLRIGRLNSDGTLDTSFVQNTNGDVYAVKIQPNGKILIGGTMSAVQGTAHNGIARLNADGTVDNSLNTIANTSVLSINLQSDGKILIGGFFTKVNQISAVRIARLQNTPTKKLFDYDGDGRADVSVFRPSTNRWYQILSGNNSVVEQTFGIAGDIISPADYDGDGKTDIGIFRPSNGNWWYLSSLDGGQKNFQWGTNGDIPRPSDFDGDGKADFIIFRPAENNWYRFGSLTGVSVVNFGLAGDKPVSGDFDGDGKSDVAIYRPNTGDWWYQSSINGAQLATRWGISTDIPAPADYDGDGKTDFAVYRASTGAWYIINSSNGSFTILSFGIAEDKPIPADYDGDGKADIAVFRPSTGVWYLMRSTAGFTALQFGISTDIPTQNAFVP